MGDNKKHRIHPQRPQRVPDEKEKLVNRVV
jgi:hypothetical protein